MNVPPPTRDDNLARLLLATTIGQLVVLAAFLIAVAAWAPVRFAWPRWVLLLGLLALGMALRYVQRQLVAGKARR